MKRLRSDAIQGLNVECVVTVMGLRKMRESSKKKQTELISHEAHHFSMLPQTNYFRKAKFARW